MKSQPNQDPSAGGEKRASSPEPAGSVPGETERIFRTLVQSSADILVILDSDGAVRYASPAEKTLTGFDPDEVISRHFDQMFHPDDLPRIEHAFQQAIDHPETRHWVQARHRHKTRGWIHVEIVGQSFIHDPSVQGVVVSLRDITDRLQIEASLRESERHKQAILNAIPDMVFVINSDGIFEDYCAPDSSQLYLAPEQFVGKNMSDIFNPELAELFRAAHAEVLATRQMRVLEYALDMPGGRQHYETRITAMDSRRTLSTVSNVTERALSQARNAKLQRQLAQAQQMTGIGSWEYEIAEDRLTWSEQTFRIFGAVPEHFERTLTSFLDRVHPEDRMAVEAAYRWSLREAQYAYDVEHRILRSDTGEIHHVRERCIHERDADGRVLRSYGTIEDVTERTRADAERKRLTAAIEQAAEVIFLTHPDGRILYVNPAFERVTGFSRQEAIGQTPRLLKSGEHDEAFYQAMWATLKSGRTWSGRLVNRRKNGTTYVEDATISPVFDDNGQIVHFVAAKNDVTEILQRESQLHQAQKMESVGRLAGGIAHDFNNMLQVILGSAELAQMMMGDTSPVKNEIEEIRKAAVRSTEITRQLLALARKQAIMPRVLNLHKAVEESLSILRRLIGEHIRLDWQPAGRIWNILMDPGQIDQILTNLCINARDAIQQDGVITIQTENICQVPPCSSGEASGQEAEFVCLTVSDNGEGMDPATLEKIFEPFYTTKKAGEGTGLGLSTVYGIVQQNGGFVDVQAAPGRGTSFRICFPRYRGKDAPPTVTSSPSSLPQKGVETILLVEDEPAVLHQASRLLGRLGYRILATQSPREALELARRTPGIHLLVTDIVMPEMNGHDLAVAIQAMQPHIQLLYMSGYTADILARHGVTGGPIPLLSKPFTSSELADKVRAVLNAKPPPPS